MAFCSLTNAEEEEKKGQIKFASQTETALVGKSTGTLTLVNGGAILRLDAPELINAADSLIGQYQRPGF